MHSEMGLKHGGYCLGCCWALMILLFAFGVMNLLWVACLSGFVLLEKIPSAKRWVSRLAGLLFIGWAVWIVFARLTPADDPGVMVIHSPKRNRRRSRPGQPKKTPCPPCHLSLNPLGWGGIPFVKDPFFRRRPPHLRAPRYRSRRRTFDNHTDHRVASRMVPFGHPDNTSGNHNCSKLCRPPPPKF